MAETTRDVSRAVDPADWVAQAEAAASQGYTFFDWLSAVDACDDQAHPGVDVVLRLLDIGTPGAMRSLLLVTRLPHGQDLPSLTGLFAGAAWHERETHEMFGVTFTGFDDGTGLGLRPLLLPEGFDGTPLRKSFQLAARASKTWPGGKEPGEGRQSAGAPSRRRVQAPGVPPPQWGPRPATGADQPDTDQPSARPQDQP